jgi:hypothetical protein
MRGSEDQEDVKREERGTFYIRGGAAPRGVHRPLGGASRPLHGGNALINMR